MRTCRKPSSASKSRSSYASSMAIDISADAPVSTTSRLAGYCSNRCKPAVEPSSMPLTAQAAASLREPSPSSSDTTHTSARTALTTAWANPAKRSEASWACCMGPRSWTSSDARLSAPVLARTAVSTTRRSISVAEFERAIAWSSADRLKRLTQSAKSEATRGRQRPRLPRTRHARSASSARLFVPAARTRRRARSAEPGVEAVLRRIGR